MIRFLISTISLFLGLSAFAQDSKLLSLDRIYSDEFRQEYERSSQWIDGGDSYIIIEKSDAIKGADQLVRYNTRTQKRDIYISADALLVNDKSISIESFTTTDDGSKVLIFTNSRKVWRSNTKGDYYVYDVKSKKLTQLGKSMKSSSLMFAKFSSDNKYVAYVSDFNLYKEDFSSGEVTALTEDGNGENINGTFDWAYEEEFGKRDGFSWSPNAKYIAFWQLNASSCGTFYMINNTDSIYSKMVPLQYPKVGQDPSSAKIGLINNSTKKTTWIPLLGDPIQHYIPGIQWINDDLLLIQQLNRKQNRLIVYSYRPSTGKIENVYEENQDTWIEIAYPDKSASGWGNNDLQLVDNKSAFLRMTETGDWRQVYKVNIVTGSQTLLTPGEYDVASMRTATKSNLLFMASPDNSTQRYLYSVDLEGKGKKKRLTPKGFDGSNSYDVSPNGKFAIHSHQNIDEVRTVRLINLPSHKVVKQLVNNDIYREKLESLALPRVEFSKVTIEDGLEIDVRMVLPPGFDKNKKYPVVFHVYGEPWGQVSVDEQIGLWNIMLAQKGYIVIDMDNRGTPCLKGSAWRKSIYRKIGVINADDQAQAAREVLQLPFLDSERTAVWGWSGGGSMTLNLLFRYPEIYKTGVAVAAVSDQLIYDNIYQERYMGLPQENEEDFIAGSPITYAKNLEGNLLLIHGTGDDNVHYQSAELLINELILHNKQFRVMPYPNRSHGIYEGKNTRRHLYTLITNYLLETTPPNVD